MGLDMYAYKIKEEVIGDKQVDINISANLLAYYNEEAEQYPPDNAWEPISQLAIDSEVFDPEFAYWRKFNALHGWMETLYFSKGGQNSDFNCATLRLTEADLQLLENSIDELTPVPGFFFGSMEPVTKEDKEEVKLFIEKAREAIKDGYAVIYDSWW